jgi:hypothetical protein
LRFRAAAQANAARAQRPGVGQAGDAGGRGLGAAGGGFGDNGDADAGRYHAADRVEGVEAHRQLQAAPGLRSMLAEMLLQGARSAEGDKVVIEEVVERQGAKPRQRMAARHDDDETVGSERKELEIARVDDVGDDADIRNSFGDSADDVEARPFLQVDIDIGVGCEKAVEKRRQNLARCRAVRLQPHMALEAARIDREVAAQPPDLLQHDTGVMGEGAARRRQPNAAAAAFQERHAQRRFKTADAFACRGQRQIGLRGAARDGAGLGDVQEQSEVDEIERH